MSFRTLSVNPRPFNDREFTLYILKRARSDMNRLLKLADDILQKFPKSSKEHTSNKAEALQTSEDGQPEGSDKI